MPLFVGVESQGWPLSNFGQAAKTAKSLGFSALIIKIADGTNVWYSALGGWQKVLAAVTAAGLKAVPYCYCYGDAHGGLSSEISILVDTMKKAGIVIADMEVEYNGQPSWAKSVCAAMRPVPGVFGVTTWADPVQQNWQSVMIALAPCVNFWMPQVYSNNLASMYKAQYAARMPVYPVLNLGTDFGPNDILGTAKAAQCPIIALWEYSKTGLYAQVIKAISTFLAVPVLPDWSTDGTAIYGPNGIPVVSKFKDYILAPGNHWSSGNWPLETEHAKNPLEISNPSLGSGDVQTFRWSRLEWTPSRGVFEGWLGQELLAVEALHAAKASSEDIEVIVPPVPDSLRVHLE